MLIKTHNGFDIYEVKATQTISATLVKEMDYFEELSPNTPIKKTLITEAQKISREQSIPLQVGRMFRFTEI